MRDKKTVRFFLEPSLRDSAERGAHNFIGKVGDVLREAGFAIEVHGNGPDEAVRHASFDGWSIFHMEEPWGPRGVTFRRAYHYPFWGIESTGERWRWAVAEASFAGQRIDRREAQRFTRYWQERLFGEMVGQVRHEGFVYVPLQGRLTERRSFQSCSPLAMLETVLTHEARPVIAALHPKERYEPAEIKALEVMQEKYPRLEVVSGQMEELLPACDYIATMNSSVAFNGYFLKKPAVLFAGVDFHHIAVDARTDPVAALRNVADIAPDYEGYLWWFWQEMSINAGRPEATEKITMALRRAGWPV
ncbi:MAG TPA: hypothetical protein DEF12_04485 [Rhodobacteraceae bacterium]|jgi:hypothetical protein|nr:hypothetical protein [Paracoccaceae bacterium]HBV54275.1 hypothetical protein [Paracoccaceae bacterium]